MKKIGTLKSRIKQYLKTHNCCITARDILLKFDRTMSLAEAVHYLRVLEDGDKMIEKQVIPDEGDGVIYAYYHSKITN